MTTAWTRERPTKPGLYWLRCLSGKEHPAGAIVELDRYAWDVQGIGSDMSEPIGHAIFDDCEWAPAEPPP